MISLMTTPLNAGSVQDRRKRIPLTTFARVFMSKQTESADGSAPSAGGATEAGGKIEPRGRSVFLHFHQRFPPARPSRAESHPWASPTRLTTKDEHRQHYSHSSAEPQP